MGKTKKIEKVLEECERRLYKQRCPVKELRKELRNANRYLGTVDWDELEDA